MTCSVLGSGPFDVGAVERLDVMAGLALVYPATDEGNRMMAPAPAPLLEARRARIEVDDIVTHEELTFTSAGDRVVLVGDVGPILATLAGVWRFTGRHGADGDELIGYSAVAGGEMLLAGSRGYGAIVSVAQYSTQVFRWSDMHDVTAEDYVTGEVRRQGESGPDTKDRAVKMLARLMPLEAWRKRGVGYMPLSQQRALMLLAAAARGREVLVAELPLSGFDGEDAVLVRRALDMAAEGRRLVMSIEATKLTAGSPEAAVAKSASSLVIVLDGALVAEGSPDELFQGASLHVFRARSNVDALRAELAARGVVLRGSAPRFVVSLSEGSGEHDLLAVARAAHAEVSTEMTPLPRWL